MSDLSSAENRGTHFNYMQDQRANQDDNIDLYQMST